jgi:hypothetical protein
VVGFSCAGVLLGAIGLFWGTLSMRAVVHGAPAKDKAV